MQFAKGHGTENDFVVLADPDVHWDLRPERVAALCDRQRGLGADGILRVARTRVLVAAGVLTEVPAGIGEDDWFMDYRNADGSIAEMCGNGVRVFAHFLAVSGMEKREAFTVGSRSGARPVTVHSADGHRADVTVGMGRVRILGESTAVLGGQRFTGVGVDVGNPHLACVDPALIAELAGVDLTAAPEFDTGLFPNGVNVELLTPIIDDAVRMRVHERGVGETRSCGTGTVAAAAAALRHDGRTEGEVAVHVPGGRVVVRIGGDQATLRGPSVLLAEGRLDEDWWATLGCGELPGVTD